MAQTSEADALASGGPSDPTATVVLVDDEADLLLLVERLLTGNGFEVVGTARDGQAGIDAVAATQPDVVLLDLRMPRLDGAAALPEIIRCSPRTMVAILSANLDAGRAESLLEHGAFAAYDKGDLSRLAGFLTQDLASFRQVLDGEDDLPAWRHRYRRL